MFLFFWKELIDDHKFDADADADEDVVDAEVGAREGKGGKCNNCQIFSSGKEIFSGKMCDHHPETSLPTHILRKLLCQITFQKIDP